MSWFVEASCRALLLEFLGQLDVVLPELDLARRTLPGEALGELAPVLAHAAAGRAGEAAALADAVELAVLRATPRSATWTCNITAVSKVAGACHHPDFAAVALQQLATLDARHLVIGGMAYGGSVAHWRGVCLREVGRLAEAEAALREGLADHRSLASPPWEAWSMVALAAVLDRIGAAEARAEAERLLAEAGAITARLGMPGPAVNAGLLADRRRLTLTTRTASAAGQPTSAT